MSKKFKIKKSTLERFLRECDAIAPWFEVSGDIKVACWAEEELQALVKGVQKQSPKGQRGKGEEKCRCGEGRDPPGTMPSAPSPDQSEEGRGPGTGHSFCPEVWKAV